MIRTARCSCGSSRRPARTAPARCFITAPTCGSTVFWEPLFRPGFLAVAVAAGAFADTTFPPPGKQVYGEARNPWVAVAKAFEA